MSLAESTSSKLMTVEEFLALPDDGIERFLIRGELREYSKEETLTRRNPMHSETESLITHQLLGWL